MINKIFKNKAYFIIGAIVVVYTILIIGIEKVAIEELNIINGVSYDIKKETSNNYNYIFPFSVYVFYPDGRRGNHVDIGKGLTVGDAIQDRQRYMNKSFIQGLEKVFVISENYASNGIRGVLDERARSNETSDMAFGMVCKGKSEDILSFKMKGYASSSDYLQGLIEKSQQANFFSQNYKIIDLIVRIDSEGRKAVLPFVEIKNDTIEITGLVVFEKDKMALKLNIPDTRVLNMLRENDVDGMISIEKSPSKYIDVNVNSKRKVICEKKGDKYSFTINLDMDGEIITNELYDNIKDSMKEKKDLEDKLSKATEESCNNFIRKMKTEYKIDCLELGREAASKYGRRKGIDWDKVVTNSDIKVNVKVKVSGQGRGDY